MKTTTLPTTMTTNDVNPNIQLNFKDIHFINKILSILLLLKLSFIYYTLIVPILNNKINLIIYLFLDVMLFIYYIMFFYHGTITINDIIYKLLKINRKLNKNEISYIFNLTYFFGFSFMLIDLIFNKIYYGTFLNCILYKILIDDKLILLLTLFLLISVCNHYNKKRKLIC